MSAPSGELSFATVLSVLGGALGQAELDLAQVTRTDSAGLSLLLELTRRAKAKGKDFRIINANAQVRGLAGFFGVDSALNFQ